MPGTTKVKFIFPFANVSKEINAILMVGITSLLFLQVFKKLCSLPQTVTGLRICHLMLVTNLVGKLWSILISPFSLSGAYQIQTTAQSIFLFWNLLYQILPEVGALLSYSLEAFCLRASAGICPFNRNQPALLFPRQISPFSVVSHPSGHLPSRFFKFGSYSPHQLQGWWLQSPAQAFP